MHCDQKTNFSQKALFLDRDGVVNVNHGYVYQKENFDFIDGIFELAYKAQSAGYMIIVVTNQSGIARKYYDAKAFLKLTAWMENQFWQKGIKIQHTFFCPHHPKHSINCICRKPRIGMITKASRRYTLNLETSILVGDSLSDMECAKRAKIKTRVLLKPDLSKLKSKLHKTSKKPYFEAKDLKSILDLLT